MTPPRANRSLRAASVWGLLSLLLGSVGGLAGEPRVEVRARTLQPGEPLQIDVVADADLVRLDGTLLDQAVFFARARPDGTARRWYGWTLIPLDTGPGPVVLSLGGAYSDGRTLEIQRKLAITPKEFPTEELQVASRYVDPPEELQDRLTLERRLLATVYGSRRSVAAPDFAFVRPVPGRPTSIFGTRRVFNGKLRDPHPGLDLEADGGTAVACSGPGRVVLSRDLYYAGNTVIVDHGGGLFTIYAHLSRLLVEDGATVAAGQQVGLSGATGRVTGPHLHWGAKIGNRPFDPTALLDPVLFGKNGEVPVVAGAASGVD